MNAQHVVRVIRMASMNGIIVLVEIGLNLISQIQLLHCVKYRQE